MNARRAAWVLGVAAVVLLAAAALVFARTATVRAEARTNLAVVDTALTDEVTTEVTEGLQEVFAYDYRHPERTEQAADDLFTGEAAVQYDDLYAALAAQGPEQQLTYQSTVSVAGVQHLTPGSAELLVFLQQQSSRLSDGTVHQAPAQIRVQAVNEEGSWYVSTIELL